MPESLNLSNLSPVQARRDRKRVGRGVGSGTGKTAGRGTKGQKARSGSHAMRAGFEGGQMPIYMRLGKQRGNTSKDAMPVGPFRTATSPVNVRDLDRFDAGAEVTVEMLEQASLVPHLRHDVKILGEGELSKKLTVVAHRFSATARRKIEAAGGTVVELVQPAKPRGAKAKAPETEAPAAAVTETGAKRSTGAPDPAVDEEPADREATEAAVEAAAPEREGAPTADQAKGEAQAEAAASEPDPEETTLDTTEEE